MREKQIEEMVATMKCACVVPFACTFNEDPFNCKKCYATALYEKGFRKSEERNEND